MRKLSRPEMNDLFSCFRLPCFRRIKWTAEDPQDVERQLEDLFEHFGGDLSGMITALMNVADVFPEATVDGLCRMAKMKLKARKC